MPTTARQGRAENKQSPKLNLGVPHGCRVSESFSSHALPPQGVREQEWVRSDGARIEAGPLTRDASLADGVNHYTKHPPQSFLL